MGEEIIYNILEFVKAKKSPKEIALSLGRIANFEEFSDGINQSRFIIDSKHGLDKTLVAVDNTGELEWISLSGKEFKVPFQYLDSLALQRRKHYNTYDTVKDVQFVFYPMKESAIKGIFTWVDESTANRKKPEELIAENVILHFSKFKAPMPSREWVYMVVAPEDILKQNNLHIRQMLQHNRSKPEEESYPSTSKIGFISKVRNLFK